MTNTIYPCLWFDGNAKDVSEFYCSVFKNSSVLSNNALVSMFQLNGNTLMALNGGPQFKINPSVSMMVHCGDIDECERIWSRLSDGAKVLMPFDKYPWSDKYGWLQDKFGFTWQIMKTNIDKMTPALLFTGKQFGRAEEAINLYSSLFGNSTTIEKNYYPEGSPFSGRIMYCEFQLNNYPIVAMDGPGEHDFAFSEAVSLVVNCKNQEEIDYYWDKLTEDGGKESNCGWCKDKFGLSWQIVPVAIGQLIGNPANGQRAMQALLKMKKLIIADLENA